MIQIRPCPFCGGECKIVDEEGYDDCYVFCDSRSCDYCGTKRPTAHEAIAVHDDLCRSVDAGRMLKTAIGKFRDWLKRQDRECDSLTGAVDMLPVLTEQERNSVMSSVIDYPKAREMQDVRRNAYRDALVALDRILKEGPK